MTGTVASGAVVNPVPKLETSTPVIEPKPVVAHPRKVAFAPSAVTPVRVAFALLRLPVIICSVAKAPVLSAIVIFPINDVVIVADTDGLALLVIVSPAANFPEVVSAEELNVNLWVAGLIVGITS